MTDTNGNSEVKQDENISDLGVRTVVGGSDFALVPEGKYDALVHGIVFLGLVPNNFKDQKGNPQPPSPTIKLIMEMPDLLRNDGETTVMSTDVTLSVGDKGNLISIIGAILDKKMTSETMAPYMFIKGLQELLGKSCVVTVQHYINREGKEAASLDRKGFHPLDARLPKPVAKRDTFFFNPLNPDLEVFEKTLTYWTQKKVMESQSIDRFPDELKQLWHKLEEQRAADTKNNAVKAPANVPANSTASIE